MYIDSIEYSALSRSLDIFISGCSKPHCKGCYNPQLWEFTDKDNVDDSVDRIYKYISDNSSIIDNIFVLGGEPLDQDLLRLERFLSLMAATSLKVWLFTRYNLEDVPEFVKFHCSYIKCGKFDIDNIGKVEYHGIVLNSTNQIIHKIQ